MSQNKSDSSESPTVSFTENTNGPELENQPSMPKNNSEPSSPELPTANGGAQEEFKGYMVRQATPPQVGPSSLQTMIPSLFLPNQRAE